MKIYCPKCGREIKPPQTDMLTGALGLIFRRAMDLFHSSLTCGRCGCVPLSEFSDAERRWFKIETWLVGLLTLMVIGLLIFIFAVDKITE